MNIIYENKLFHGKIESNLLEKSPFAIEEIGTSPDIYSGKANEIRQRISNIQENILNKCKKLDTDIIKWNSNYSKILGSLEYLEAEINDRLFLRSDTDGFYKSIVENFTRPEAVDLDTSTVDVDFWGNTVKLKSYANSNNFLPPS